VPFVGLCVSYLRPRQTVAERLAPLKLLSALSEASAVCECWMGSFRDTWEPTACVVSCVQIQRGILDQTFAIASQASPVVQQPCIIRCFDEGSIHGAWMPRFVPVSSFHPHGPRQHVPQPSPRVWLCCLRVCCRACVCVDVRCVSPDFVDIWSEVCLDWLRTQLAAVEVRARVSTCAACLRPGPSPATHRLPLALVGGLAVAP
jgi:hypothetical protein